jgi:hypothetical protein
VQLIDYLKSVEQEILNQHDGRMQTCVQVTAHLKFVGNSSLLVPLTGGKVNFGLLRPETRPYVLGKFSSRGSGSNFPGGSGARYY